MSKDTFFKRQTSDQPGWAKGVENVIIVGGLALVAWKIYKDQKAKADQAAANPGGQQAAIDLAKLEQQGVHPTRSDTEFQNMASILVQAMNGCGTDEDSIYGVFQQMNNDADVLKLIAVFGFRGYQPCVWTSPVAYSIWLANDKAYGGDLGTWLGYDLGASEIQRINGILNQRGITIQF